ncbi:MAG: DUF4249 domain-containing protein [Bacteroidales bacterium]|nr:DUF4249 domain-containing protein [Bacteroidales bacterium]
MNKLIFFFILWLPFVFSSCDDLFVSELEIDDYPIKQRLVLNAVIKAECDSNFLFFNNSYSFFDKNTARKYVLDPTYFFWLPEKTVYLTDVDVSVKAGGLSNPAIYYTEKDSLMYFKHKFMPGDEINIHASNKERSITSKTIVPQKPVILQVDTLHFKENSGGGSMEFYPRLRLLIRIQDEKDKDNYYRIYVDNQYIYEYDPEYVEPGYSNIRIVSNPSFLTDDPLLNSGYTNSFEIIDGLNLNPQEFNSYSVFTDELFKDGEYTLNLHTEDYTDKILYEGENPMIVSAKHRLKIGLTAINEDFYYYLVSLQKQSQLNENRIEPIQVYNNIEGGLGIFGAINELEYIVFERNLMQ